MCHQHTATPLFGASILNVAPPTIEKCAKRAKCEGALIAHKSAPLLGRIGTTSHAECALCADNSNQQLCAPLGCAWPHGWAASGHGGHHAGPCCKASQGFCQQVPMHAHPMQQVGTPKQHPHRWRPLPPPMPTCSPSMWPCTPKGCAKPLVAVAGTKSALRMACCANAAQ